MMTINQIRKHFEDLGCSFDPIGDGVYIARNPVSSQECQIEEEKNYSPVTLAHYFYEVGVSCPKFLRQHCEKYRLLREEWARQDHLDIPKVEQTINDE